MGLLIGPVQVWWKTYTEPGADPDWNSVSGFTEILTADREGDLMLDYTAEYLPRRTAKHTAAVGRYLTDEDFKASFNAQIVDAYALARGLGLLDATVTDKSAASPKRYQFMYGGWRPTNWGRFILRQKDSENAALWRGLAIIKGLIRPNGALSFSMVKGGMLPVIIETVTLESGTHEGGLVESYFEYELDTPVIDTILPASRSVGDAVCLSGQGFGNSQGDSLVTFFDSKVAVTYLSWTDNAITCVIPTGALTGNGKATVNGVDSADVVYTIE